MPIRVLIVDDHAPFRALARQLLTVDGFDVVGEASSGAEAIAAVRDLRPDVDGFGVAEALTGTPPAPRIVLISSRDSADYGRRVTESAADGFIAKAELSGDTLRLALT